MSRLLRYLLIFVPLAVLAELVFHNHLLIFITSALALIPLAGLLGEATEALAEQLGPQLGGLLNATLGNAAELIITIVAIRAGRYELVKASITGSILGNLLLIIGFALLLGGLRHGIQRFDRSLAGLAAALMTLAVIGLIIPTMFELTAEIADPTRALDVFNTEVRDPRLNAISLGVAAVLLTLYLLSLVYQFRGGAGQTAPVAAPAPGPADAPPAAERSVDQAAGPTSAATSARQTTGAAAQHNWSVPVAVGVLAASTLAIVFMSEFLVGVVEPVAQAIGVRELFLGVILIPIVGNVAEHLVGVQAAMNNQMDLSMNISLGSSMQIALFVAPLLVFVSLLLGPRGELTLFFSLFEVMALVLAVLIAAIISLDGESNWLEGAMLLAVYLIMAIGFFYVR